MASREIIRSGFGAVAVRDNSSSIASVSLPSLIGTSSAEPMPSSAAALSSASSAERSSSTQVVAMRLRARPNSPVEASLRWCQVRVSNATRSPGSRIQIAPQRIDQRGSSRHQATVASHPPSAPSVATACSSTERHSVRPPSAADRARWEAELHRGRRRSARTRRPRVPPHACWLLLERRSDGRELGLELTHASLGAIRERSSS